MRLSSSSRPVITQLPLSLSIFYTIFPSQSNLQRSDIIALVPHSPHLPRLPHLLPPSPHLFAQTCNIPRLKPSPFRDGTRQDESSYQFSGPRFSLGGVYRPSIHTMAKQPQTDTPHCRAEKGRLNDVCTKHAPTERNSAVLAATYRPQSPNPSCAGTEQPLAIGREKQNVKKTSSTDSRGGAGAGKSSRRPCGTTAEEEGPGGYV